MYVTKTGTKYHTATCRYVAKSKIVMKLSEVPAKITVLGVQATGAAEEVNVGPSLRAPTCLRPLKSASEDLPQTSRAASACHQR